MTDQLSVAQLPLFPETLLPPKTPGKSPSLHTYWHHPLDLPGCVSESLTILRCLELFEPLDWDGVPERNLQRNWGQPTLPYTALIAAELVKLNETGDYPKLFGQVPGSHDSIPLCLSARRARQDKSDRVLKTRCRPSKIS